MRYMLLIYMGQSTAEWEQLSEVEQEQILHEYRALSEARGVTGGEQLQPVDTATTVRVQDRADHRWLLRGHEGGARRLLPA